MNRRQLLAAIPGLGLLSRLRGKKEEPETATEAFRRIMDDDDVAHMREHKAFFDLDPYYQLSNCNRRVIEAGFPDDLPYGPWGYRRRQTFYRPTFAELSRQWDATCSPTS